MNQSCDIDHGGCPSEQISSEALAKELARVPDWQVIEGSPMKIRREFKFSNFKDALAFTNKVGEVAEEMNHHPDILLKWGSVRVDYWTHNAGGLTEMDFEAARLINKLFE